MGTPRPRASSDTRAEPSPRRLPEQRLERWWCVRLSRQDPNFWRKVFFCWLLSSSFASNGQMGYSATSSWVLRIAAATNI